MRAILALALAAAAFAVPARADDYFLRRAVSGLNQPEAEPCDALYAETVLLFRGEDEGGGFTDLTGGNSLTGSYSPIWDSATFAAGTMSVKLTGFGQTISAPAAVTLGSSDFTLEGWYRAFTVTARSVLQIGDSSATNGGVMIRLNGLNGPGSISAQVSDGVEGWGDEFASSAGAAANDNDWHHVAVTRSGSAITVWFDGAQAASGTVPEGTTFGTTALPIHLGGTGSNIYAGWIDDVRLTLGAARYDGPFTPEASFLYEACS